MMKSIMEQLQDHEAILLMYLAGELPEQDRAQVERLLQQDGALQAQLESLRAAMGSVDRQLADVGRVDDIAAERAIRQTTAAMRSYSAEQRQAQVIEPATDRWRIPGWAYPAAAAAILLVAVSVYLANMRPPQEMALRTRPTEVQVPDLVVIPMPQPPEVDEVAVAGKADDLAATFDDSEWVMAEALDGDGLIGAMVELGEIERLSGEPGVVQ